MRHYELVTILSPMLNQDQAAEAWDRIKEFITSRNGEITQEFAWGTRRLAYPIHQGAHHFLEGSYQLTRFSTEKSFNQELETFLHRDDRVLRSLVVATEEAGPGPTPGAHPGPVSRAAPVAEAQPAAAAAPPAAPAPDAPAAEATPASEASAAPEAEPAPTAAAEASPEAQAEPVTVAEAEPESEAAPEPATTTDTEPAAEEEQATQA